MIMMDIYYIINIDSYINKNISSSVNFESLIILSEKLNESKSIFQN